MQSPGGDLEPWASLQQRHGGPQGPFRTPHESLCDEIFRQLHKSNNLVYVQRWGCHRLMAVSSCIHCVHLEMSVHDSVGCLRARCMIIEAFLFICSRSSDLNFFELIASSVSQIDTDTLDLRLCLDVRNPFFKGACNPLTF